MFLTKKKKKELFNFEERIIKTKGFYGEDLELKVLTNKMLGDLQILAPNKPISGGVWIINEKEFFGGKGYRIILKYSNAQPLNNTQHNFIIPDNLKARLKTLAASAIEINIYLNKALEIQQVEYSYLSFEDRDTIRMRDEVSVLYEYLKDPYMLLKADY